MTRRHPISRSARARIYTDPHERAWALYGRSLAWWGWRRRDVARVAALLAGVVVSALLNTGTSLEAMTMIEREEWEW